MAKSDMFLKVTGQRTGEILGESSDKLFPSQIDVIDWAWAMSAPSAMDGARAGRTVMEHLKLTKRVDKASTALMAVMNSNELLTKVILSVRKPGGAAPMPFFVMTLEKVRITGYQVSSSFDAEGMPALLEHVLLAFKSINIQYAVQNADGSLQGASGFIAEAGPV